MWMKARIGRAVVALAAAVVTAFGVSAAAATPSGGQQGWVDSRNVNNYTPSGIAGVPWCW
jgi:hypothetical protein